VIEHLYGARFSITVQTGPWGLPIFLLSEYRVSFLEIGRPRLGVEHLLLYRAEVKERVQLYLLSRARVIVACCTLKFALYQ